jgi:hypothetical protein
MPRLGHALGQGAVLIGLAALVTAVAWQDRAAGASVQAPVLRGAGLVLQYEDYREVRTNGNDSTYGQGLTHRYVDGELRFLTLTGGQSGGVLHEFRLPEQGRVQTETTGRWNLRDTGALNDFVGIWFEQRLNRLWVTSARDYTAEAHRAKVTLIDLGPDGRATVLKQFFLDQPAKRVYGGCQAVPDALIDRLGGPYVCGWGGYTSLLMNGGNASLGPTMYAIPDPDTIEHGRTVDARTILDAADAQSNRGVRLTIPQNYFDGGDRRSNPPTRPTEPPRENADWLSPNRDGLGWMVWGDSYYNTGFWVGTTFGAVASLCKGACWYQSSTLAFDGRQFELHLWNGETLGRDRLERPAAMFELDLPRGNERVWKGNVPTSNISGATYDATGRKLYLLGFPFGADDFTGRLYSFTVATE